MVTKQFYISPINVGWMQHICCPFYNNPVNYGTMLGQFGKEKLLITTLEISGLILGRHRQMIHFYTNPTNFRPMLPWLRTYRNCFGSGGPALIQQTKNKTLDQGWHIILAQMNGWYWASFLPTAFGYLGSCLYLFDSFMVILPVTARPVLLPWFHVFQWLCLSKIRFFSCIFMQYVLGKRETGCFSLDLSY